MDRPVRLLLVGLLLVTSAYEPQVASAVNAPLVADAYTRATSPTGKFGTKAKLLLQASPASAIVANSYLRFDLSTLPTGTVGSDVAKATLMLGINNVLIPGAFDVYRVTEWWTEAEINDASAPNLAGSPEISAVFVALADKNGFKTVDVTALVRDWLDNVLPNHGVALVPNNSGIYVMLDSKENRTTCHFAQLDITLGTAFSSNLSGDVTGSPSATTVSRINNSPVGSLLGASSDQVLAFNGSNWNPSSVVNSLTAGSGINLSSATGHPTVSVPSGAVSNSMLANSSVTVIAGTGLNGGGAVALGASTTLSNSGVLSVETSPPLASSGGQNPSLSLTGLVPVSNGGTGSGSASGARSMLGAAASGANADITSLWGITGNINLPDSTSSAAGNILKGGVPFIHSSGSANTFVGANSGNFSVTGTNNTAVGAGALFTNTTGVNNTAVGVSALWSNTTGGANHAIGRNALWSNTSGYYNIAVGVEALKLNTTGHSNTAVGVSALWSNTTGNYNHAIGRNALGSNTTGYYNIAIGVDALMLNTTGNNNTAVGDLALGSNTTGAANHAIGRNALWSNTTGNYNIAVGVDALKLNTTGHSNAAVGESALWSNTTGSANNAMGKYALGLNTSGDSNTAVGESALGSNGAGSRNIAIGRDAGLNTTGDDNIDIGNPGIAGERNTIRIGTADTHTATFIAGISGATASGGTAVFVNSNGQLGTITSSARFKDHIQDMGDSTSALLKLRPVRFRYKASIDPSGLEQYGLIAEEVAKVYPDLVVYDEQGRPQTVRYHFINAMLLNEVKKQARVISAQERQLKALAAQLDAVLNRLTLVEAAVNANDRRPAIEASDKVRARF